MNGQLRSTSGDGSATVHFDAFAGSSQVSAAAFAEFLKILSATLFYLVYSDFLSSLPDPGSDLNREYRPLLSR